MSILYGSRSSMLLLFWPTYYADTSENTLWSILVLVTNWYDLAGGDDDGLQVEC